VITEISVMQSSALMKDDVAANRPMLAALCVSKMRPGIPARGFFLAAKVLGVFSGDPDGPGGPCLPRARAAACAFITAPAPSTPCTWNTNFAISRPIVLTSPMDGSPQSGSL
jgi:hypothetical protein